MRLSVYQPYIFREEDHMSWLSFFMGMIVGGGIIYYFWRSNVQQARETEQMLRQQRAAAENETRQIKAQFDNVKRPDEQLATCQTELQKKTKELQQVTQQLSTAESQIRALRDQLAATGTKGEQLAAAEAQIQTLRDQLDATEAKAATRRRRFATAKARMRDMNDQLAATAAKPEAVREKPMPVMAAEVGAVGQRDDLTKIEGIGPKVSQVLYESGILTFAQLAHADVSRLRTILQDAGPRFRIIEPESWPQQAGLAANGNWDALRKLQDELDGGKYRR
jgi:predicted flap endonuclease-1-like 5' DNA nuclease